MSPLTEFVSDHVNVYIRVTRNTYEDIYIGTMYLLNVDRCTLIMLL